MGQGCGLGRTLVQQVKMSCRVLGLKAILLHTASRMLPIVRFYYGQGFFIHSTTHDRGYIRALMVYELSRGNGLDYFQYV